MMHYLQCILLLTVIKVQLKTHTTLICSQRLSFEKFDQLACIHKILGRVFLVWFDIGTANKTNMRRIN